MKNPISQLLEYFRSSKAELEKVTWPTRKETLRYSSLVVGVSIAMAVFFATLDFGLGHVVDLVLANQPTETSPTNQPIVPDLEPIGSNEVPTVEGVDAEGNIIPLEVTPIPLDDNEGGITVSP